MEYKENKGIKDFTSLNKEETKESFSVKEKESQLILLNEKILEIHNQITSFPDILSKFGMTAKSENMAHLREEYTKLNNEKQSIEKSLKNHINQPLREKKELIAEQELELYPEKKSLFKRLKELFSFRDHKDTKNIA